MSEIDSNFALVSLADAKEYLKIAGAQTSDDTIIEKLINRISAKFSSLVGRPVIQLLRYEYYNGNGDRDLILRCHPILSITKLYNADANRNFNSTTEITVANDVIIQPKQGMITLWNNESRFRGGVANVKLYYTAGWKVGDANNPVPYDVQDAINKWVARDYMKYDKGRHERISVQKGDISETYVDESIPKEVEPIIKAHKDFFGSPDFSHQASS